MKTPNNNNSRIAVSKSPAPLEVIELPPVSRLVKLRGLDGETYHALSTEVASVLPIHTRQDGVVPDKCRIRLKDRHWIDVALSAEAAASLVWPEAA